MDMNNPELKFVTVRPDGFKTILAEVQRELFFTVSGTGKFRRLGKIVNSRKTIVCFSSDCLVSLKGIDCILCENRHRCQFRFRIFFTFSNQPHCLELDGFSYSNFSNYLEYLRIQHLSVFDAITVARITCNNFKKSVSFDFIDLPF